jgi:hypothetical protein
MGSFQITYDDFSGGQYMGNKSSNLPKNSWFGENVIPLPNGQLMPVGQITVSTITKPTSAVQTYIQDFHLIGADSYLFTSSDGVSTSRMIKTAVVSNGTLFPITSTSTTLTAIIDGKVAFNPAASSLAFYYIGSGAGAGGGTVYSVSYAGANAVVSTALAGLLLTDMVMYGFRLLAYGGNTKRLYYSDTTLTTWSTANYYEFTGNIINVIPRTNDLLVICDTGVFSLVGVLGSSITSQLIVPSTNIPEGMRDATAVNRNIYYFDQQLTGAIDGRIYRLTGSTAQPIATLSLDDVNNAQSTSGIESVRVSTLNDGKLCAMDKVGRAYAETVPGTWVRLVNDATVSCTPFLKRQHQVSRPGPNSFNEFFLVAYVQYATQTIYIYRYIYNVTDFTDKDRDFTNIGVPSSSLQIPTGTVTLSEYWHSKPFTVKEVFVEYYSTSVSQIDVQIIPTGMVDVIPQNVSSMVSTNIGNLQLGSVNTVMQRFRPNDANKGFGVKPKLEITYSIIKRVILNCED